MPLNILSEETMFFNRNKKSKDLIPEKFRLSDNAIMFIKKYALAELHITNPIDVEMLDRIIDIATQWEMDMIDPLSKDGCDKTYDYPERERNETADKFVGEITGKWDGEKFVPDLEDLNKRLGLIN